MKKLLIYFIVLILFCSFVVSELEMCQDTVEIETNCKMVTNTILPANCDVFNYSIIDISDNSIITQGNLTEMNLDVYYFNFTETEGDYVVQLCNLVVREVKVREGVEKMLIILSIFAIGFIMTFLGFYMKNAYVVFAAGLWFLISAFGKFITTDVFGWDIFIYSVGFGMLIMWQGWHLMKDIDKQRKKVDE